MPMGSDEQLAHMEAFAQASKESVEETDDEEGIDRMEARAEYISEKLSDDE